MKQYSKSDRNITGIDTEKAVFMMLEYYEKVKEIFHGFDYSNYNSDSSLERARTIIEGMDFILELDNKENGIKNFILIMF